MSGFSAKAGSRATGDLARWGPPPILGPAPRFNQDGEPFNPHKHTRPEHMLVDILPSGSLPLMPVQASWIERAVDRYGFDDIGEVIRHLVFAVNAERKEVKKLVFKIKRCLHCHVGARQDQHAKVNLSPVQVYSFQLKWLTSVVDNCPVRDVGKALRIICDYYMSRVNEAEIAKGKVDNSEDVKGGDDVELELFTRRRSHDSRVTVAIARWNTPVGSSSEVENKEPVQILSDEAQGLKGACSPRETAEAIRRCQVGRGSASYAESRGETAEETKKRRELEVMKEDGEEMKRAKELIRKTLG
eukprot:CAMPEP_0118635706 /NCGR_PEP_ID=MMETSP0785-20121206/2217_1 /TAXON_ID=91992 /ORGANISM="Bolidomonas pacifica, Strain CCMP 1866" /LENGTH=300 /DNA_ID=CAMNT_0006526753 /DNA_START=138 /DNA_END=1037 /DNA_ORIENTATION=+